MTSLLPAVRMTFGGQDDPAAFIEVRSVGIPDSSRNSLTAALTDPVARSCEIKTDRIYVVLADIPGQFWALKGMTLR